MSYGVVVGGFSNMSREADLSYGHNNAATWSTGRKRREAMYYTYIAADQTRGVQ
jgi:hypothetical protein